MKLTITLEDYLIDGLEIDVEFETYYDSDELWNWDGSLAGYSALYLDEVELQAAYLNEKELNLNQRNIERIQNYIKEVYEDEIFILE